MVETETALRGYNRVTTTGDESKCNRLLSEGWELIHVATDKVRRDDCAEGAFSYTAIAMEYLKTKFVLGNVKGG